MHYLLLDKIRCLIPVLVTVVFSALLLMNEVLITSRTKGKLEPGPIPIDDVLLLFVAFIVLVYVSLVFKPSMYIDRSRLWRSMLLLPIVSLLLVGSVFLLIFSVVDYAFLISLLYFLPIFNLLCFYMYFIFDIDTKWNDSLYLRSVIFLPTALTSILFICLFLI